MHGIPTNVWFDRPDISPYSAEDTGNVDEMCDYLEGLVAQEWTRHGIAADRVIVGKVLSFCASSLLYINTAVHRILFLWVVFDVFYVCFVDVLSFGIIKDDNDADKKRAHLLYLTVMLADVNQFL